MLGHAEATTRRLLEKVVAAAPGFDLIEIEGDAAFLSSPVDGLDADAAVAAVTHAAIAMHRAFHVERRLVQLNMCPCGSCTQTSDLRLKFVAHVGEVATQTIKRRRKLVGVDVIYVHRLLKNSVGGPRVRPALRGAATTPTAPPRPARCTRCRWSSRASDRCTRTTWTSRTSPSRSRRSPTRRCSDASGGTFGILGRGLRHQLSPRRADPGYLRI